MKDIYKDILVSFYFNATSNESNDLIRFISDIILKSATNVNKSKLYKALCVLNVALLRATYKGPHIYAYRSMGAKAFTGEIIGLRPFTNAVNGMVKAGLINRKEGYCPASEFEGNLKQASRFKPTAKLIALWESCGIVPSEWNRHFEGMARPGAIARPIALKTAKRKKLRPKSGKPIEIPSERMKFDPAHPLAKAAGEQVNAINDFLAGQDIQPSHAFYAFERIYSLGDDPLFNWDKGGRLYALEGGYQQWPSKPKKDAQHHRSEITINGEPVVEVDIRASHLTILHALKGVPMGATDPYSGTGFPRFVVKSYVAYTLGHVKKPGNQWSKKAKAAYASKECEIRKKDNAGEAHCADACKGKCLQKLFPMSKIGPEIAKHFPILDDWETSPYRWADLQFIESQAVIDAVHELCVVHNVPALPVHDSIIIPASKKELAEEVLSRMFKKHAGVSPVLKVSAAA